ncbi:DUF1800 domain-containing protein [Janthinobacterium psychrotolerans]|uniref:Putative conserved protein, DUF1800 family n=1 Tax=Janthinobacterium psychrotolerans TaxID=1747903 RepID=A0A1A7C0B0_9BURK|nr:DUF1800 domain-containing protein [Janthinobacterium psychrotolerans]OBV38165.1 putative conserved protein, DUF1800 family [Janthinobacterium psychrotolerans]
MTHTTLRRLLASTLLSLLAACGGGGGDSQPPAVQQPVVTNPPPATSTPSIPATPTTPADQGTATPPVVVTPAAPAPMPVAGRVFTRKEASRFLGRATFGPNMAAIDALAASDSDAWFADQFARPQTTHLSYMDKLIAAQVAANGPRVGFTAFYETFWQQAIRGEDQLRQRVAFALSQIFVISMQNETVRPLVRGTSSYYDMLGQHAFGNFRNLLDGVARHPMMGIYLSHMRNQKESGTRTPDENFAREVMQLFTIGLVQLNADGSVKLSGGKPIDTYSREDVAGLAKVFTGLSWAGPDQSTGRFNGSIADPERDSKPMQMYPAFHSTSEKRFLGQTISGATSGDDDIRVALDTLFNHPNAAPFFSRQLIQRLVTSNPGAAYVGRVSAVFANNGKGVRGDMQAIVRAVLLDPEAVALPGSTQRTGKLREPLLRLANWMRAFDAKPANGIYNIYYLDDPLSGLAGNPLNAPSVFNYYRPSYVPPNSAIASAGLVAPEMQLTSEPSVTGYLNFMQEAVNSGVGDARLVKPDYTQELAASADANALVDRVDLLLLNGAMTSRLRGQIVNAVNSIVLPAASTTNGPQIANLQANRVKLAIFLAMASTDYLVQK